MDPKISIIVPVYKVEQYIHKCIDSILAQTFHDFELILVNDGSPDKCGLICDQYAERDYRIEVIHKENGGLSSARNAGIQIAKGEFIGFIDSDDFIHEKMYEVLYNNAKMYSSDIVVCDLLKVNENESYVKRNLKFEPNIQQYSNLDALFELFNTERNEYITGAGNNVCWIVVWNKLYKRSLFENLKFEEGRIYEDEFIIHRILYRSRKITFIPIKYYYYLQRHNSIVNSAVNVKKFDKVYALKDRADFFREIKQKQLHNYAIKSYVNVFFWYYTTANSNLVNVKKELNQLKKTFNKSIISLMKNPLISLRQKVILLLFFLSPISYERIKRWL